MTQEEYLNLSPEEQNALFATEVLGGLASSSDAFTKAWMSGFFDPNNNLDHAMMGVDKLGQDKLGDGFSWTLSSLTNGDYEMILYQETLVPPVFGMAKNKKLAQVIMLACLRAKGILE